MIRINPKLIAVHKSVLDNPLARRRAERMIGEIPCKDIREVDDAGLARLVRERWQGCTDVPNQGMTAQPEHGDVVFNTLCFDEAVYRERVRKFPELETRKLHGHFGLSYRADANPRMKTGSICTTAWELHSAYGCGFLCSYCSYGKTLLNICVNIEEEIKKLDEWTDLNIFQTVYKWDNATDINCFEPEYDATRLMVEYFRNKPNKYLLLYAGKSDNVDFMLDYDHGGKTIVQWSLSPETQAKKTEIKAASMQDRILAMKKCQDAGYLVRCRFSPILPVRNWEEEYARMIELLLKEVEPDVISVCFFGWMTLDELLNCIPEDILDPWAVDLARRNQDETRGHLYGPFPHEVREKVYRFIASEVNRRSPKMPMSLCLESEKMWEGFSREFGRMGDGFLCNCGPTCSPGTAFYENRRQFFTNRK